MAVLGELEREKKEESWTEMASRWIGFAGAVTSGDEKAVKVASDAAVAAVTPSVVTSFCQLPRLPTLRPLHLTRRPLHLTRQMIDLFTTAFTHRDGFFAASPRPCPSLSLLALV
jgi:hypothetical protein